MAHEAVCEAFSFRRSSLQHQAHHACGACVTAACCSAVLGAAFSPWCASQHASSVYAAVRAPQRGLGPFRRYPAGAMAGLRLHLRCGYQTCAIVVLQL
jgi:hypothetical protein